MLLDCLAIMFFSPSIGKLVLHMLKGIPINTAHSEGLSLQVKINSGIGEDVVASRREREVKGKILPLNFRGKISEIRYSGSHAS